MTKPKKWKQTHPKTYTCAELARIAGVSPEEIKLEIAAGNLSYNTGRRIPTEQALSWMERRRSGAAAPDGTGANAPAPSDAANGGADEQLQKLFGGDIMSLLGELNVGEGVVKNAAVVERISKTLLAVTQQNERAIKIQAEAGRHVDTADIQVFLDKVFTDWIAEIRAMPSALEYRLSNDHEMAVEKMRGILQEAANYLIQIGNDVADKHSERMAEFQRHQADRARRRVDGARRAAVQ